jgi:succinate dehydrogenase / fumarate reductase cytochrome b subunit
MASERGASGRPRPLSPHLTIWKWGPHMAVSILHRVTGTAMATAGTMLFVWWLVAAATSADAYATFYYYVVQANDGESGGKIANLLARLVGVGLTWAFFQHMFSGIRHLVLDTGAGYELRMNKRWAMATMFGSVALTLIVWAFILTRH